MKEDIDDKLKNAKKGTVPKYNPVPVLVLSLKLIHCYISVDNCIVLKNPTLESSTCTDMCYDIEPHFIGKNIILANPDFTEYKEGVDIRTVYRSKIALLCSKTQFKAVTDTMKKQFLFVNVPDDKVEVNNTTSAHDIKLLAKHDNEYVLIMFGSNLCDSDLTRDNRWNIPFADNLSKALNVNLLGTPENSKHHETIGKYHGIGIIAKYALDENLLSVAKFSGNESVGTQTYLEIIAKDIQYVMDRQHSAFPMLLYCGFSLVNVMLEMSNHYPDKCQKLSDLVDDTHNNINKLSVSNWLCENAETKQFHQEFDSSYTFLSVPFWDVSSFIEAEVEKGDANFIFKWTSNTKQDSDQRYLSLQMKDGMNIFFSGYGCFHRQHLKNQGKFWNFASYQNTAFYDKVRASILRCLSS